MCNITVCLVGYIALRKKANIYFKKYILKICFGTFVMIIFSMTLNFLLKKVVFEKIATIVSISVGTGIYIVLAVLLGLIKKEKN